MSLLIIEIVHNCCILAGDNWHFASRLSSFVNSTLKLVDSLTRLPHAPHKHLDTRQYVCEGFYGTSYCPNVVRIIACPVREIGCCQRLEKGRRVTETCLRRH